jgi:hypothetical protein
MKSVIEICSGDTLEPCSVPDTDFVIVCVGARLEDGRIARRSMIMRAGVVDEDLSARCAQRFGDSPRNIQTARRIAGWLREGAP